MTKTIFSVLRTSNGSPESAEIISSDLPLWEKIGYKKVGERTEEIAEAAVAPAPKNASVNSGTKTERAVDKIMLADDFDKLPLPPRVCDALREAGYKTFNSLKTATDEELLRLDGIGKGTLSRLRDGLDGLDA